MSFFDDVIGAAKSVGSAFSAVSSPLSGVLGFLGGERRNDAQADQAAAANAFSAQQYASRYQTTVADMKAAGINPMLAYGSGPGNAPSGQQASVENTTASGAQAALMAGQVKLLDAQADAASAQAAKTRAETPTSGNVADVNIEQVRANVQKILAEVPLLQQNVLNAKDQGLVLRQTAQMLTQQSTLMAQQGQTQEVIRDQLVATIEKLKTETSLNKLDIDAALNFENFGREFQQYKPIIDLLKSVLGRGR